MRFVVLLYQEESVWAEASPQEQERLYAEHDAFAAAVTDRGCSLLAGEALTTVSTATTVRRRGDRLSVTEGPFAETTEQLGGFYLVDAPDLDVLTDLVRLLPEYTVEIRPVAEM
ncbi:YciI family protein [Actinotalea sp. K2]|uniref:YciI family protein n=1 Tax=Actinotalea sp. K2 TaxID=2939438 RepID=UPI002016CE88|nr:YciI family protein [Actinotalea sp. K2]MCL3861777.1 YciI family protein [Actinotalea sp. K2]